MVSSKKTTPKPTLAFATHKTEEQEEEGTKKKSNPFIALVHGAVPSNTFALYGNGEEKELTELVPNILNQLGPDSLASLRKLAESYQNMQKQQGDKKDDEEDDIPDLVEGENFETKE